MKNEKKTLRNYRKRRIQKGRLGNDRQYKKIQNEPTFKELFLQLFDYVIQLSCEHIEITIYSVNRYLPI